MVLQEDHHYLPAGIVFSHHPLRVVVARLLHHRLRQVAKRVTLPGWPLRGINYDGATAMLLVPLLCNRPKDVQVFADPR